LWVLDEGNECTVFAYYEMIHRCKGVFYYYSYYCHILLWWLGRIQRSSVGIRPPFRTARENINNFLSIVPSFAKSLNVKPSYASVIPLDHYGALPKSYQTGRLMANVLSNSFNKHYRVVACMLDPEVREQNTQNLLS
jgi:hypothetical protein